MKIKLLSIAIIVCALSSCDFEPRNNKSNRSAFEVSPMKDTTLLASQGTRIFIERDAFEFEDGSTVNGPIKIDLQEFYQKSDILLAGLTTHSDGKLLETGGMLNIVASAGGRTIRIKSDKRLVVHFPKSKKSDSPMNLFFGKINQKDSVPTTWDIDTVSLTKETLFGIWGNFLSGSTDSINFSYIPKNFTQTNASASPMQQLTNVFNFSKSTMDEIGDDGISFIFKVNINGKIKNPVVGKTLLSSKERLSSKSTAEVIAFINGLPELEPHKDKKGDAMEVKGFVTLSRWKVPRYGTNESYIKSFNRKYAKYEGKEIKNMDEAELEYYIFSVGKLGWINCDRFVSSEKTTDLIVDGSFTKNTTLKIIFKDVNGVLPAERLETKYVFHGVPVGKKATIVAIDNSGETLKASFHSLVVSDLPVNNLLLKEITLAKLKQELDSF